MALAISKLKLQIDTARVLTAPSCLLVYTIGPPGGMARKTMAMAAAQNSPNTNSERICSKGVEGLWA